MASYLILEPRDAGPARAEKAVAIRDGFAYLAFLAPLLWFLWHRLWLEALAVLAAGLMLGALGMRPGFVVLAPLLSLLLSFLVGLEATGLRVAALRRRGWTVWGVVEAANREEAEIRYAAEVAPEGERPAAAPPTVAAVPPAAPARTRATGPSFGLMDYPRKS